MRRPALNFRWTILPALLLLFELKARAQAPVVVTTNTTIRVMTSNLSSGNNQRYEAAGLDILKGLKSDIVALQEFNYASTNGLGINTAGAFREMVDAEFGTNFVYFRESSATETYTIPNGIVSRYPIISAGSWDDTLIPDRGFAWAQIDLPGSNALFMVSIHLKASSGSSAIRASEAANLKALIQSNFPSNAFIVVAGDCNLASTGETALTTFKSFLSDNPIPTDAASGGDSDTNAGRTERYDYVFPSPALDSNRVATVIGTHAFSNGLVFDSRIYSPLSEVAPVLSTDSGATGMQHMGVVKDFLISYNVTNVVTVPPPILTLGSTNILRWQGLSNVTYSVQASTNLPNFATVGTAVSITTNISFTNQPADGDRRFFRVIYP